MDYTIHRSFDNLLTPPDQPPLKALLRVRQPLLATPLPRRFIQQHHGDTCTRLPGGVRAAAAAATCRGSRQQPTTATTTKATGLSAEVKQQQEPQAQASLGEARRRAGGDPDGDPGGPGPDPDRPPSGPGGPNGGLPFRMRYWIMLLAEYGGMYGTAAVILAALTHVDAFGGVHWDASDVAVGLGLMAPALVWDAVVGLPDWRTREQDAAALVRLFVDPELLQPHPATRRRGQQQQQQHQGQEHTQEQVCPQPDNAGDVTSAASRAAATTGAGAIEGPQSARTSSATAATIASDAAAASVSNNHAATVGGSESRNVGDVNSSSGSDVVDRLVGDADARATALPATAASMRAGRSHASSGSSNEGQPGTSSTEAGTSGGDQPPAALWAVAQRLRMALELMQESSIRNNPGARLTPLQEVVVILVAVLADEMLYRAVLLTLFGRWLRDRFYEAGAEDTVSLGVPWQGPGWELGTAEAAQWAALSIGVALGAAVFAAKAWQEATVAHRLRELQLAEREEAAKALRKQRLLGQHMTEEELREMRAKQARLEAAQASLVASIGMQGALVWMLEGSREVYQVAASGASFILTGNLAAPLMGSLAGQLLVSLYQRIGLQRSLKHRAQVMARRRAALQRRQQEEQQQGSQQPQQGSVVAGAAEAGVGPAVRDGDRERCGAAAEEGGSASQVPDPGDEVAQEWQEQGLPGGQGQQEGEQDVRR